MNCFHFSVSLGYKTTLTIKTIFQMQLWIAFIFQYLWDTKQHIVAIVAIANGCELLSFFSIFGIQNNGWTSLLPFCSVVNCFHFSVSLGYKTTEKILLPSDIVLWIAFIFQYLWDTKQHRYAKGVRNNCCELLSFFSILGYKTTVEYNKKVGGVLWIAFIFQYLWDTKQPSKCKGIG